MDGSGSDESIVPVAHTCRSSSPVMSVSQKYAEREEQRKRNTRRTKRAKRKDGKIAQDNVAKALKNQKDTATEPPPKNL